MAKEKIALVTGANKGIGFEIARELAEKDFRVFLAARDPQRGAAAAATLRKSGARVEFLQLDVADLKSIKRAFEEFSAQAGQLDVLVNNAGIYEDRGASILDIDPQVIRTTLETNTLGPLLVTQQFWPLLAKSGSGRVINMSSGMGALHDMGGDSPAYSLSKTALNAVTRQFAAELKDKGITVNSVCPGGYTLTWAEQARRALPSRARTPSSGWPPRRQQTSPAFSFATGGQFPGERV